MITIWKNLYMCILSRIDIITTAFIIFICYLALLWFVSLFFFSSFLYYFFFFFILLSAFCFLFFVFPIIAFISYFPFLLFLLLSYFFKDEGFDVFLIICLGFFIFEFISSTIVKTRSITIWPKFKIKGYLFSFFWFMDIIFIIALYADIQSLGRILNTYGTIYNLSIFGGGGLAGRGARLCRLIKVIQQYKASADLRKKKNQESGLYIFWLIRMILYIQFCDLCQISSLNWCNIWFFDCFHLWLTFVFVIDFFLFIYFFSRMLFHCF